MAQSVSNDALWEKLKEMDKKLNELAIMRKSVDPKQDQAEIKLDFSEVKDEIIAKIKEEANLLGTHSDVNFGTVNKNIELLHGNIGKVFNIVSRIRKQQKESVEPQTEDKERYFSFKFFKIRKASFVIAVLFLLVFLLTLFCMKQQNDYVFLMDEYCKQGIVIRALQKEAESVEVRK